MSVYVNMAKARPKPVVSGRGVRQHFSTYVWRTSTPQARTKNQPPRSSENTRWPKSVNTTNAWLKLNMVPSHLSSSEQTEAWVLSVRCLSSNYQLHTQKRLGSNMLTSLHGFGPVSPLRFLNRQSHVFGDHVFPSGRGQRMTRTSVSWTWWLEAARYKCLVE